MEYNFFTQFDKKTYKLDDLYKSPYKLKVLLWNYDDNNNVEIITDKVNNIDELPQNITELINKYDLLQHYINSYTNDYYLQFDIIFYSENDAFKLMFMLNVDELKQKCLI